MPMPHRTQMQVIKRRLTGKDGSARVNELRSILAELPGIYQGPYGKIRVWVEEELERTNVRRSVKHNDSIAVPKEGHLQVAVVGMPNAGKSSLLKALSGVQTAVGAYPFTTLRPVPALVNIGGVQVQFVEVPGLIEGARDDRGGGRALLGVIRSADFAIVLHDPLEAAQDLDIVVNEIEAAGIGRPRLLVLTKADRAGSWPAADRLAARYPGWNSLAISSEDGSGLAALRDEILRLSNLMRVFPRTDGQPAATPVVLPVGASALEFARGVHNDFAQHFRGARVWGGSARFPGQQVGPGHVLLDGDQVELKRV
ncbi:MAG: GTPase [Dehalococcoidia bacterium]